MFFFQKRGADETPRDSVGWSETAPPMLVSDTESSEMTTAHLRPNGEEIKLSIPHRTGCKTLFYPWLCNSDGAATPGPDLRARALAEAETERCRLGVELESVGPELVIPPEATSEYDLAAYELMIVVSSAKRELEANADGDFIGSLIRVGHAWASMMCARKGSVVKAEMIRRRVLRENTQKNTVADSDKRSALNEFDRRRSDPQNNMTVKALRGEVASKYGMSASTLEKYERAQRA